MNGRIIITAPSDAAEHAIEAEGGDVRAIYHPGGLYYGYDDGHTNFNRWDELLKDIRKLVGIVQLESAPVVLFGAHDDRLVLRGSIEAARSLLAKTQVTSVLVPVGRCESEVCSLEIFGFSKDGLRLVAKFNCPKLEYWQHLVYAARQARDGAYTIRRTPPAHQHVA